MKYRGKKYETAIKELKSLKGKLKLHRTSTESYKELMLKIVEEFGLSKKTIYRDMNKRVPGLRKTRNDAGKVKSRITKSEVKIAEEIMSQGKDAKEAMQKIESKTGKKISGRKMQRVIKYAADNEDLSSKSFFGGEAKKFFENIFEYDLIAPDKGIPIKYNSFSFIVRKDDLRDIIIILSNAYNRAQFADNNKLPLDRTHLRSVMIQHLIEDQMKLASESSDYKLVESLTRMIDRMNSDSLLPDDFGTMLKVCQQLKPDISKDDVISLIKKVSEQ